MYSSLQILQANFETLEFKKIENEEGEEEITDKLDFDSEQGVSAIREIIKYFGKLFEELKLEKSDREYRKKFSRAYRTMLESQGSLDDLCYVKDILDSAQENYAHLWVNGEKYVFSDDVVAAAKSLTESFAQVNKTIQDLVSAI
jgi:hypothetical protein